MDWVFHKLKFKLLSQLHIGRLKIGNIQRTRHYIPAKSLWAALTARLTRDGNGNDYSVMGSLVRRQIAFSYFFPGTEPGPPCLPSYENGALVYASGSNRLSSEEFAWHYCGSYASTALDYDRNAAAEASLHEVEFISPTFRHGDEAGSVFLHGYAIVAPDCKLPWEEALRHVQVGGERRYGWGRLLLVDNAEIGCGEAELFGHTKSEAHGKDRPTVTLESGAALPAHCRVSGTKAVGPVEPVVGRAWQPTKGAGQEIEFTAVCYTPGAVVEGNHQLKMGLDQLLEVI